MSEFAGKTALITGASRGIGKATAIALAQAGVARLIVHYSTHKAGVDEATEAVRATGATAETMQADLSTDAGIDKFCLTLARMDAPIDILVNNAGSLVKRAKLLESTPELFDEIYTLNVKSAWFVARAVVGGMIARKSGAIVNLSSIAARHGGGPGAALYSSQRLLSPALPRGWRRSWPHTASGSTRSVPAPSITISMKFSRLRRCWNPSKPLLPPEP
jgi:3-oxoacyl-[acyl-carrier protein] reductase